VKDKIAIIGIGCVPARGLSPDVSYREMTFEAAVKAYEDAGISPREVDTFMTASEDMNEGVSIFDEYTPDQMGAVLKPVHTISGDGLIALASAYMQIATGGFRIAVVEAHSKLSNVLSKEHIEEFGFDPIFFRNMRLNPEFVAAMDMRRYMHNTGAGLDEIAHVPAFARRNALRNDVACYGAGITSEDVLGSETAAEPLTKGMIAQPADGACVIVIACADVAAAVCKKPVWIEGISFCTAEPSIDTWEWGAANYCSIAAKKAYKMAGIKSPSNEISFAEVDDRYAHKFLAHMEALGLTGYGIAGELLMNGAFEREGEFPVNSSGGHFGIGMMHEAACLYQLREAVLQLRGEAGQRQIENVETGLVQSWRGLPTQTGAVAILRN